MATTDFNSPNVLTTTRLTEETLIQTIVRGIIREKDLIQAGKLPEASKAIAKDVNILYMKQIIEAYYKGMKDGASYAQALDFSQMERAVNDWEKENGPIKTEPIGQLENPGDSEV